MNQHPLPAHLDEYRLGSLRGTEARAVDNHLMWCVPCRRTVHNAQKLAQLVETLSKTGAVEEYIGN